MGLILLANASLAVPEDPTSATICTSHWIGNDPGNLPHLLFLFCNSSGKGRALGACDSILDPFPHPALSITFVLAMLEWKSKQTEIVVGFSAGTHSFFFILRVTDSPYTRLQIFLENGREVGLHFAHFRERRQGVQGGRESTGRYHFFSY